MKIELNLSERDEDRLRLKAAECNVERVNIKDGKFEHRAA